MDSYTPLISKGRPGERVPQYVATITGTLCVFGGGAAISWISPALPMLISGEAKMKLSPDEGSWVSSLLPAGAVAGALVSGPLADAIGRKMALVSQGVLLILSWIMILVGQSTYALYLARVIAGIVVGVSASVSPLYISEIAEESLKGTLCSYTQLMIVSGVLYGYVMGAFFSYGTMTLMCELIPIAFIMTFTGAPESPLYCLKKGMRKEAEKSLFQLRGKSCDIVGELNELDAQLKSAESSAASERGGWDWFTVKVSAICLSLMAFQQLSGINIVIFYCTDIFMGIDGGLDASYAAIVVGATQVAATYFSTLLLDRTGRKVLLVTSSLLMAVSLITLGAYFNQKSVVAQYPFVSWLPLFLVVLYMVAFSLGMGPIPFVMLGELLPVDIKATVAGLSIATNWTTAFFVVKSFNALNESFGADVTYWIFGGFCVAIAVIVQLFVIETRGRDADNIRNEFQPRTGGYEGI